MPDNPIAAFYPKRRLRCLAISWLLFALAWLVSCRQAAPPPASTGTPAHSPTPVAIQVTNTAQPLPTTTSAPTEAPPTSTIMATTIEASATPTATATPGIWQALARMPTSRSEMPAVAFDGRIYIPGGYGNAFWEAAGFTFEAYDPADDSWQTLAPLPYSLNHHMLAVHGDYLYVFGDGNIPTLRYDPAADSWTEHAVMPEARWAGAAVTLDDYIYIIGGQGATNDLLRYDPLGDTWERLAPMRERREHLQAVAFEGKIMAIGGRWDAGLTSTEIYDPATGSWRAGPSLRERRSGFGAAVTTDGRIVVAGGELLSPLSISDTIEFFDPATGQWALAPFTLPRPLHGFPLVVVGDALYVIGGSIQAGEIANRGDVWVARP